MAWPGLFSWTVAAAIAAPLALGALAGAWLLAVQALAALAGVGLWLAYLVENGSETLAWIALGFAAVGLVATLAAIAADDPDADAPGVGRWVAAGMQCAVFVFTGAVCLLAGIGVQSPGF